VGAVTFLAVDWSGARTPAAQRKAIAVAAIRNGRIVARVGGLTRAEAVAFVADQAPPVVAGFDFSFSVPRWFSLAHGACDVDAVWALAEQAGERWLTPTPPFWRRRCIVPEALRFRACERDLRARGFAPKSVFQLVGNGQVGAGSVRGMPLLRRLRAGGWAIWPFDDPGSRTAVEVYPTLLRATGGTPKGRYASLHERDATAAAHMMWRHRDGFGHLARATDPDTLVEGAIWEPRATASP
jgi:hypothetical protein